MSVAVLLFAPGVAAADTAVLAPPAPAGLAFSRQLDPQLLAELEAIEERVLQEQQQGRQLQQQEEQENTKIQANNQKSAAVRQKVTDWNAKAEPLEEQAAALGERIDAHNAKPNTFELPRQQAEADAYQAEVDELQSEKDRIQSQQNELDNEKSAIDGEQDQVDSEGRQLDREKQQIEQQITAFNQACAMLESQLQQLLQQVVSTLQSTAAAQPGDGAGGDQAAGGDPGRPVDAATDNGQAGNDGGDPSSPKATDDALDKYGQDNDVTVYKHPARVLLTPGTVTRLSPGAAAALSPYHSYDGLVPNPDQTYTALEVVAPGARPDPFDQAINQGGQATVEVNGRPLVITRVQTVPGGWPGPEPPVVPAPAPAVLALLHDNGQILANGEPGTAEHQVKAKLPAGTELARPTPWDDTNVDPGNTPRKRPGQCTSDWQDYGPLQGTTFQNVIGKRATGAEACVVTVNAAPRAKLDFNLFGLDTSQGMARCHLIGHSLNGSDSDLRNFVPCYQNPTNNSWMYWRFEYVVAKQVRSGDPVYLMVRPVYQGQDPLPVGIMGYARSNNGWACTTFIPNVTQGQASSIGNRFQGC
ncbi:DNA/RNA non-specific endonuclease [Amycolatopsis sp. NBC_00345]|uniref:DNA/RNA non-specific endonuclease n=1 Tax=Amycolatopsis sp. NBC_00345 TaxID=2975955 RepID=UPI002E25BBC6